MVATLVRTDEGADKPHRNLTAFLVEKPTGFGEVAPGLTIPGKLDKLVDGYALQVGKYKLSYLEC